MTAADSSPAGVASPAGASVRGNLVIGVASIVAGAVVIPYGAGMPYVREGIPGPGLFPMMIGGMLILLGALIIVTSLLSARRERLHRDQLAVEEAQVPTSEADTASASDGPASAETEASSIGDGAASTDVGAAAAPTTEPLDGRETPGASVPVSAGDVAEEDVVTQAVMDTDIGSDGARRWINGAILMGGIVFYVLFAETLGFPLTMAILVTAIVWSLRARWWAAALTGVLSALGLWLMFEQGLLVQLPDGPFKGF